MIKLYGADWCPDCQMAKQVLNDYQIKYDFINLEKQPQKAKEAEKISGKKSIPVIIFPNNIILVEPSKEKLIKAIKKL